MNKKQAVLLFNKYVLDTFNATWGNNVLSAKAAEERYKSYGITPPHKIFYEYKFPDGMSRYELLMRYGYMYDFQSFQAGDLMHLYTHKDIMRPEHRKIIECYTPEQIQEMENYILAHKAEWAKKIKYYSQELRRLNPELQDIHVTSARLEDIKKNNKFLTPEQYQEMAEQSFVHGTVFGYSPDDINYFINRTEAQCIQDQDDEQLNFIRIGHIIAPQHRDDFVRTEQQIQQIKNAQKKHGHE